uniref:Uncharacterized protein n=1 Tax=Ditylenchus dipsaci TaxID=166011 RepID=A0A915CKT5_9BILA
MPSATGFKGLEWCEYMKKIGAKVKECESLSSEVDVASKEEDINEPDSYETKYIKLLAVSMAINSGYLFLLLRRAMATTDDAKARVSVRAVYSAPTKPLIKSVALHQNQCPSVDQMGYQCRKKNLLIV